MTTDGGGMQSSRCQKNEGLCLDTEYLAELVHEKNLIFMSRCSTQIQCGQIPNNSSRCIIVIKAY